jgi:hypothetical protein
MVPRVWASTLLKNPSVIKIALYWFSQYDINSEVD